MCEINLEAELFTLQDSNAKLVEALQEANSSVEQWKKQLSEYQEETDRLRDQVTCTSLENVTLGKCLSGYLGENNCNYLKSKLHSQAYQVSIVAVAVHSGVCSILQMPKNYLQSLYHMKSFYKLVILMLIIVACIPNTR